VNIVNQPVCATVRGFGTLSTWILGQKYEKLTAESFGVIENKCRDLEKKYCRFKERQHMEEQLIRE
jgi:predicted hydrocarbon binding protein